MLPLDQIFSGFDCSSCKLTSTRIKLGLFSVVVVYMYVDLLLNNGLWKISLRMKDFCTRLCPKRKAAVPKELAEDGFTAEL